MRVIAFLMVASLFFAAGAKADDRDDLKPIIDKAVKAAGGGKLTGLKAWTYTIRSKSAGGPTETIRTYIQLPDQSRMEIKSEKSMETTAVIVLAGEKGWGRQIGGELKEMDKDTVALQKRGLTTTGVARVLMLTHPEYKLTSLGESKLSDRVVVGIKAVCGKDEQRLYLDKETSHLVKIEFKSGPLAGAERLYEDFKEIEGITTPRKWVHKVDGKVLSEFEVIEFKVADKLDAKLFEKP